MLIITLLMRCSHKESNPVPTVKKKVAWVVGAADSTGYGMILFSLDGGTTWQRQGEGLALLQGIDVEDIWAVDEDVVWAVCTKNTIIRSQNGGQGWIQIQGPAHPAHPELMSISIIDRTNIWISGSNGAVYNSTDGGDTWILFDTNFFHSGGMQGIWAITPQKVFVTGGIGKGRSERGFVGYTLNGGVTWDSVYPANDYNRNEWIGVVASGSTIVVYGGKSHYMVSTDGGATWRNDSLDVAGGGGGADINHMIMLNPMTWWAAMDEGHIYLTENAGATWSDQSPGTVGGMYLVGIDAWDYQLALVVGQTNGYPPEGKILKTLDGGTTWNVIRTYNSDLFKVSFIRE